MIVNSAATAAVSPALEADWKNSEVQISQNDPLLKCLVLLTHFYNKPFAEETLCAGLPLVDGKLTPDLFTRAAKRASLAAKVVDRSLAEISPLVLPAVLILKTQGACILKSIGADGRYELIDPDTGGVSKSTASEVASDYSGRAILVRQELQF